LIITTIGFAVPAILCYYVATLATQSIAAKIIFIIVSIGVLLLFGGLGLRSLFTTKWSHVTIDFNNGQISYAQAPPWFVYCASKKFVSVGEIRWGKEDSGYSTGGKGKPGKTIYNITMLTSTEEVIVNAHVEGDTDAQRVMSLYSVWFDSNLR